jgi:cysteine-rich repeat protein
MAERWQWAFAGMIVVLAVGCHETFIDLTPDGWDAEHDVDVAEHDADVAEDGGETIVIPPPLCGDGALDPGEECDDGNRLDGDDCDWSCRLGAGEPPGPPDGSTPRFRPDGPPAPLDGSWDGTWLPGCYSLPILWTDESYAVFWYADAGGGWITRFDRSGHRVGMEWSLPNTSIFDAAWNGSGFAVTWCVDDGTQWMQILGADGKPMGEPILLASHPSDRCWGTTVDWDGEGYVAFSVWSAGTLRFVRTDALGTIVVADRPVYAVDDPDPDLGCLSAAASEHGAAAAMQVTDPSDPGEVGRTEYSVVSRTGTVLRAGAVIADCAGGPPDIEWDGRQYGVLTFGRGGDGLFLARLSPEGVLLGPPTLLDRGAARDLALAAGLGWAAAWGFAEELIRTDTEGRVVQRIPIDHLDGGGFDAWGIALAFDGEGFGMFGTIGHSSVPYFVHFSLEPAP